MKTAIPQPGLILAIDLGKYKSVACLYESATAEVRFRTIRTNVGELLDLLEREHPAVVVIETGAVAGWVYDLCTAAKVPCHVANTSSEAWKFQHTKRKTDKDDALRLASLYALGQLPTVTVPPKATREWRGLISYRQSLVGRRVTVQNRLRALLVGQGIAAPVGARAWTAAGLAGFAQHAKPLADCGPDELWRGLLELALTEYRQVVELLAAAEQKLNALAKTKTDVHLLESIPGVGPRTAETVVAYLGDPHRFDSAKEVSAYAGLVPRQYQSGTTDRRGRITRRGPALLRKLLVECAWCCLRYNAWARSVFLRLSQGKARRKQAIVALARKLLVRCWAMLRDGTRWRGDPAPEPAAAPA
jgi:transposase